MSKFLDRLKRISRGTTISMGFGAAGRSEKLPSLALVGTLSDPAKSAKGAAVLAGIGADGALIQGHTDASLKKLAKTLDNVPWGVRVEGLQQEQASRYKERGCDFLAFRPEGALVGALEDEDTGYLLCVQPDMDERFLRAIEDLPIDAVLLPMASAEPPLTLQHLITIGSVRGAFSKYLLLEVPGLLSTGELEALRDIGVDGLVVDATAFSSKELEGLSERLMGLPRRQSTKAKRPSPILPISAHTQSGPSPSEQDEDEDEF